MENGKSSAICKDLFARMQQLQGIAMSCDRSLKPYAKACLQECNSYRESPCHVTEVLSHMHMANDVLFIWYSYFLFFCTALILGNPFLLMIFF